MNRLAKNLWEGSYVRSSVGNGSDGVHRTALRS